MPPADKIELVDVINLAFFLKVFAGLLAVANPLGIVPVFLSLTNEESAKQKARTARTAAVAVLITLLLAALFGSQILSLFGVSVPAFRTGGGLLILLMAINMLHAQRSRVKQTPEEMQAAQERDEVAVVPLAIPIIAGPGAMSLVISYAQEAEGLSDKIVLLLNIAILALAIWLAFASANIISKRIGITRFNIITRIMGLILTAIGVQMISDGLKELFPLLMTASN